MALICKKKIALAARAYYDSNRENIRVYDKAYSNSNKDRITEYQREWYLNNKQKVKTKIKAYKQANPDKIAAKYAKYRASKLNATPKWLTKNQLTEMTAKYTLAQKLSKITKVQYHVDHIEPLQGKLVSGLHVPWNLRVITASENLSKGNRH